MFERPLNSFKNIFLRYRITKRKNNIGGKKDQYIMQAVHTGIIGFDEICKEASFRSSMSPWDVKHAAAEIAEVVKIHLAQGRVVELGELGRYKIGFNCAAEDHPDKLSKKNIKKFHLNFQPSKSIKQMLKLGFKVKREGQQ
jgi:predicted histone-like DNA-binding protein